MQARALRHLTELHPQPSGPAGGGTGSTVNMLGKPPEHTWRDHAVMLLHIAAAIEHALMVQYLFAAYSLGGDQVPERHRARVEGWRNSILAVAKEEMGHLLTVQNVLALLGGPISLDREDYPWDSPFYPAPFTLAPLSLGSLAIYVYAEMPEVWEDDDRDQIIATALDYARSLGGASRPAVNRVGVIYEKLIAIVADHRCLLDSDFRADSLLSQASWDEWGRGYRGGPRDANVMVDVVATRDEALEALHRIAHQGESPDASRRAIASFADADRPPAARHLEHRLHWQQQKTQGDGEAGSDPSHFARFLRIYREFADTAGKEGWNPAHPVVVNPSAVAQPGCTPLTDEASARWANLFNLRYRMLLAYLTHALVLSRQEEDGEAPSVRGAVMHRVFAEMYNLRTIAGLLVRRRAGGDAGACAGPPFQMPYTLTLPTAASNRWLLHRDLIVEAGNLRRELLRMSPGHSPAREEAAYLAAMSDIDRQTAGWLTRLLEGAVPRRRARA